MKLKSSTVIVAAAFALSVVLLFAKAGMMRERATADRPLITNHVYSPAAADPQLRDRDAAARVIERPKAEAQRAVVVREPTRVPARQRTPARPAVAATPAVAKPVVDYPFHVITGTFSNAANAERALAQLKERGYRDAFIGLFDDGTKHCTIAGKFKREDHARVMLSELKTKWGTAGYIYEKTE